MKVYTGIIKKVLSQEQYELIMSGVLTNEEVNLNDTLRHTEGEQSVSYIGFRLSRKELDKNGNTKFMYNEQKQEYQQLYESTPVLYAYSKQMRIIMELGEYAPVKIVCEIIKTENGDINKVICIQSQSIGKLSDNT